MEYVLNKLNKLKNTSRYSKSNRYSKSIRYSESNIDIYYLLYKIKNSNILWIVKIDENLDIILENHRKIKNTDYEDYIVVKKSQPYDLKFSIFKQFNIFIVKDDYEIIYDTQI